MPAIQDLLYRFEEGQGVRHLRTVLWILALAGLAVVYNVRSYRNLGTPEAMDAAQVARNVAEGRGFTTQFIRPLSIHLMQAASGEAAAPLVPGTARLQGDHPDLANPPAYPLLLAGLFKATQPNFEIAPVNSRWNRDGAFWWYGPDFIISVFNQVLFVAGVVLVFLLARKLFEPAVAWLTALLMVGTELFWRFAVSGLSTMLVVVLFLGLCWCLVLVEERGRDVTRSQSRVTVLAVLAGLILGFGGLTRYSFAWLLVPLLVWLLLFSGPNRVPNAIAAVAACLIVMAPWMARNVQLSGLPFGTSTLAVLQGAAPDYQANQLERSLSPDLGKAGLRGLGGKLKTNLATILPDELPRFTGSWLTAFFLVGLMVGFVNPAPGRLRYFVVGSLAVFCLVEALGRTHLWTDSPVVNSENLLFVLAPLVMMFGVGFFYVLLERAMGGLGMGERGWRTVVLALFLVLNCVPLLLTFTPPRTVPHVYPPYDPPTIQRFSRWMNPDELIMSDVPWAVAWYGRRQCIWLTPDTTDSFFAINDHQKPVRALYLTPVTLDSRLLTDWLLVGERDRDRSWAAFVKNVLVNKQVPESFPLVSSPNGFLPEQLFLSDRVRWKSP